MLTEQFLHIRHCAGCWQYRVVNRTDTVAAVKDSLEKWILYDYAERHLIMKDWLTQLWRLRRPMICGLRKPGTWTVKFCFLFILLWALHLEEDDLSHSNANHLDSNASLQRHLHKHTPK